MWSRAQVRCSVRVRMCVCVCVCVWVRVCTQVQTEVSKYEEEAAAASAFFQHSSHLMTNHLKNNLLQVGRTRVWIVDLHVCGSCHVG